MGFEVLSETETLPTLSAAVGPFARVEPQVASQALPKSKSLGADRAGVGLLSSVEALMTSQNLPVFKGLTTFAACVAISTMSDDFLHTPYAIVTLCKTAQTMPSMETLVRP